MFHSPICPLSLFILIVPWSVYGGASPAARTSLMGTYQPSSTDVSKPSINSSRIGSIAGTASSGIYSQNNIIGWNASSTLQDLYERPGYQAKVCLVGRCSQKPFATKTVDDYVAGAPGGNLLMLPDSELQAGCVLWNDSCSGDKTSARNHFFGTLLPHLQADACFTSDYDDCTKVESPARLSEMDGIKSWMRSPQCFSGKAGYFSMVGLPPPVQDTENCCGICGVTAGIVDVYYWPAPNASTSCLDVVGTDIFPLTYGATTGHSSDGYINWIDNGVPKSSLPTYWGCTTKTGDQLSFLTTARITQINSITFKQWDINPWSDPSCVGSSLPPPRSSEALAPRVSIRARAHSLTIHNATTRVGDRPASTAVVNGFTFTSPSIYANFQSISGYDECGSQTISSTMLSFTPGGLSTIEGGFNCATCLGIQTTRPFDFRDLPCPPQSVMEANWYKPAPGEPYRPLIAMPEQIQNVNPFFGRCTDVFFTGFDPPKTLLPATAMVPTTTAADPDAATSIAPMPNATQNPGARKTASGEATRPVPVTIPAAQDPQETANPARDPKQSAPALVSQPQAVTSSASSPAQPGPSPDGTNSDPQRNSGVNGDPKQATDPTFTSDNSQQGSGVNGDSGQVTDPTQNSGTSGGPGQHNDPGTPEEPKEPGNAPQISYPSNVSPDQMSQIRNALAPSVQGPQAAPTSVQEINPGSSQHGSPSGAVPMAPGGPQAGNTRNVPNDGPAQQNPALPPLQTDGTSNPIPGPPATTVSVSNQIIAVGPSGVHFDGPQIDSNQANVVVSSVMAMNPSAGTVFSGYIVNPPSPTQPTHADIQPTPKYQPTIINGESAQRLSNGVSIAGATITPGAAPITISGTPIAVGSSGLVIGASTIPLATVFPEQVVPANTASYQPTSIIGQIAKSVSNGISIAGVTLAPGAPPIIISGTPVSVGSSQLVVGSSTVPLAAVFPDRVTPSVPQYQPTTINGEKAQLLPNGGISIAGTTLTAGTPAITISGNPVSAGSSNLIVGSSTVPLAAAFPQNAPNTPLYQPTTINGQKAQLLPDGISIAGSTLTPGAPAITISGTPISIGSSGLVLGTGNPIPLTSAFSKQIVTTLAGQPITILPTAAEIAGAKLTPGAPTLIISGIPIYVGSSGLVVGSNAIPLVSEAQETMVTSRLITTLAGQAITALPTAVEVAGTTLTPGAPGVTLSGTLVSLNTAGGLVLGSQTIALQSESLGLGGLIMAPFATSASLSATGSGNGTGTGVKPIAGGANGLQVPILLKGASALVFVVYILVHM